MYVYTHISALSTPHAIVSSIIATSAQLLSLLWKVWLRKISGVRSRIQTMFQSYIWNLYSWSPCCGAAKSSKGSGNAEKSKFRNSAQEEAEVILYRAQEEVEQFSTMGASIKRSDRDGPSLLEGPGSVSYVGVGIIRNSILCKSI